MIFFFSSRRRHTRSDRDWSSDVCSSDLEQKKTQAELKELTQERELAKQARENQIRFAKEQATERKRKEEEDTAYQNRMGEVNRQERDRNYQIQEKQDLVRNLVMNAVIYE